MLDSLFSPQCHQLKETVLPSLTLLTESSRIHRETRKFLRSKVCYAVLGFKSLHRQLYFCASGVSDILCLCAKVLPPLRDVKNRPEVGNTLRNKLVRLMTNIDTDVKDCAAEFLFILCKENGEELCLSSFQISSKTK